MGLKSLAVAVLALAGLAGAVPLKKESQRKVDNVYQIAIS